MRVKASAWVVSAALLMSLAARGAAAQSVVPAGPLLPRIVPASGTVSAAARTWSDGYRAAGASRGDPLWNGILIGMGAGALYGMAIAPPQFCGHNNPECGAIVRVVIGLPSIGAGAAIGALIDHNVGRERAQEATVRHRLHVAPIAARATRGVQARIIF